MKLLGVIGGMSWTSTAEYYRRINLEVARRLGGLHSARRLHSVGFAQVAAMRRVGDWAAGRLLAGVARQLAAGGADGLLLATNTMHTLAPQTLAATALPHIADATGARLQAAGFTRAGLLATAFTVEQDFYTNRLAQRFGLDVLVPDVPGRAEVHRMTSCAGT